MKLGVYERLILLNILPAEGDITTLRVVHGLKQRLSFSEEEHAALEFRAGADWTNGCPRCKSAKVEAPDGIENAPRNCTACGLKGAQGAEGSLVWNRPADAETEIELGSKAEQIIRDRLAELNKQKKLTEAHLSLCEKFEVSE